MRLPRRIFLNVVIFVSSFLVVSYHLSSIVPQDGTVHNVLYRYLFRTIFLFRPRAPAAPCSRSFLLSYCSTPPLKRKIKFSLQTVPFVPTPAAFFLAAGGVVIRRTIRKNPVFFGASCRGLLVCAQFALQGRGCYRRHNTRIFQHGLLFSAHFPAAGFFHPPCWNAAHISHFSFFRARGCYTRHFLKIPQIFFAAIFLQKNFFTVVTLRTLLRFTHSCWNAAHSTVVTQRTFVLEYST